MGSRTFLIISLFITISTFGLSQTQFSKLRINLEGKNIMDLSEAGLEVDHGEHMPGRYFLNVFSQNEIAIIDKLGFEYEVIIEDMTSFIQKRYQNYLINGPVESELYEKTLGLGCDEVVEPIEQIETPENYQSGTLAGYYKLHEAYAEMDKMQEMYPDLISERIEIGDIRTHGNKPIYYLKISEDVTEEADRPEILYTAIHHAREPGSLTQLIFYMWYLLENYDDDPEIKYLVDNTEMYFIPVINVDGYIHNQNIEPLGGGFWRKNRYPNTDGDTVGVDLNRNYGFEWAFDDSGSSPNQFSDTYRGPGPFSEPETQAVKELCLAHDFKIALNYHTFGNLLIHPWGFDDSATEDDEHFKDMGSVMTITNDYFVGTGSETVGYVVNGDSDDWMYGEQSEKNKILSLTPEVGPGFWANPQFIEDIDKTTQRQNLNSAHLLLNYYNIDELNSNSILYENTGTLSFDIKRIGLEDGPSTIRFEALTDGLILGQEEFEFDFALLETDVIDLDYNINGSVPNNSLIEIDIIIDNGTFERKQNIRKVYKSSSPITVFETDELIENNFDIAGDWGQTNEDAYSPEFSMTDSPNGTYSSNVMSEITLNEPIDLSSAEEAYISFWTKWEIENNYDYAQVMASFNGVDYAPICGRYTNLGTSDQDFEEPLFDGVQEEWVEERMSLNDLIGAPQVFIKFRFVSDGFVEADGFYFDDFKVEILGETLSTNLDIYADKISIVPNPSDGLFNINLDREINYQHLRYNIYNMTGKKLHSGRLQTSNETIDVSQFESGTYFIKFFDLNQLVYVDRLVKI